MTPMKDHVYYKFFLRALAHHMKAGRPHTTQKWLGKEIGLCQQMIGYILNGKKRTKAINEEKIARAFGFSFVEFLEFGKKIGMDPPLKTQTENKTVLEENSREENGMSEWKELYISQSKIIKHLEDRIKELEDQFGDPYNETGS